MLPRLKVVGNEIQDESGNQVVLYGVNAIDPAWMEKYYHHWDATYFEKMKEWGVKIVRIPVHFPAYRWFEETQPGSYIRLLEQGIEWAARNGIYSVIDFHAIGYPPTGEWQSYGEDPNWGQIYQFTPEELKEFWRRIAQEFAHDARIAFYDLFNEPAKDLPNGQNTALDAWLEWRNMAEELIDIIREYDPQRLFLVGGLQFSYDLRYARDFPVRREGVVYSTHTYPWSMMPGDWHANWDTAFGMVSQYVPVIVGEVGFDPDAPDEGMRGTPESFGIPLLDGYLKPRNIGWIAWNFGPEWPPCLVADWNWTPTVAGSFFRERMRGD